MSEASQFRQYADDAPLGRKCDNGKRETVAHRACAHLGGSSSYEPESHARGQLHFDRPQYSPVGRLSLPLIFVRVSASSEQQCLPIGSKDIQAASPPRV